MHISLTTSFNMPVSIALATLVRMINAYEKCLNTTNYPIFNMQDFRYCLWTSILDCFGQLVSHHVSYMLWWVEQDLGVLRSPFALVAFQGNSIPWFTFAQVCVCIVLIYVLYFTCTYTKYYESFSSLCVGIT